MDAAGRIRVATIDDAEAIGTLHARSWKTAYRGILGDDILDAITIDAWVERRRKALGEAMLPGARNWVIEDAGGIRGWACTAPARDADLGPETIELLAIYLAPEAVGRGHGRRLMDHAIADALAQGAREMTMWVLAGNERAQRFYRKAGFVPDERVEPEDFRDTGSLKLRMWRTLP